MANSMIEQARKAEQFRALHIPGHPLVLFNIWDAGSANGVARVSHGPRPYLLAMKALEEGARAEILDLKTM